MHLRRMHGWVNAAAARLSFSVLNASEYPPAGQYARHWERRSPCSENEVT
jgi:hypothetical protein